MPNITRISFKGHPDIDENREFIVSCQDKDGGRPYISAPEPVEFYDAEIRILGPVAWGKQLTCPKCSTICAKREVLQHTYNWMLTIFPCPNHPKNIFLDVFPKMEMDTTWDFTNAFAANIDPVSNPDTPPGVTITNRIGPGEYYGMCQKRLADKPVWIVTPDGIENPASAKTFIDKNWFLKFISTFFLRYKNKQNPA